MLVPPRPTALARFAALALLVGLVAAAAVGVVPARPVAAQPPAPALPFAGAKPDAVLLVTGQTYGYLQPCGCSRPQLGGLERRANLVRGMKDKGWAVAGVDLGDVLPVAGAVPRQVVQKYATTLPALRDMGYVAVGLGRAEFDNGLFQLLEEYAGKSDDPPVVLGANVGGADAGGKVTPRERAFPGTSGRPMVRAVEVVEVGGVSVGVTCVVGPSVQKAVAALGAKTLVGFTAEKDALAAVAKELAAHAKKPAVNVLLYQGALAEAKAVAKDGPFRVVVCLSDDSEPPAEAEFVARAGAPDALVVRVGHKGRYVGLVGVLKTADGFDLKYQLVEMGEAYNTPGTDEQARAINPALRALDAYSDRVKSDNLLGKFPVGPHPAQAAEPKRNLTYVGSAACAKCHAAESTKWEASKHAHAYEALEKAKRPAGRQWDGECVVCHTVGFGYRGGYRDELSTPGLKNVGCESCHGPGSGHAADPKDVRLLALQSPWRRDPADRLPDADAVAALAKLNPVDRPSRMRPAQTRAATAVARMCAGCHDTENDPRFDLFTYWPQIVHPSAPKK